MKIRLTNSLDFNLIYVRGNPGFNLHQNQPWLRLSSILLLMGILACVTQAFADDLDRVRAGFQRPPDDCRIMMRWWWFGPSVAKPELQRELRAMKDAGIGGVELQPVYPLQLNDPGHGAQIAPFLSSEFLDDVHFAADKSRELGLRFDVTLGSGWPFGGPHIPVTEAAGKLRLVTSPVAVGQTTIAVPALEQGEGLIAAFVISPGSSIGPQMLDLKSIANGRFSLPETSKGERVVTWYISSRTGMVVKRAALGAEGFVLDHFNRSAIEDHLRAVGDSLLGAFGDNPPYAVFSDSLEVYGSDWTGNLLQEFKRRRGYDLVPLLPALTNDLDPQSSGVRHDWGKTLTELINKNYLTPIREWAQQHHTRFRSQTYGIPAVTLFSNSFVDLPEGEGDDWRAFSPSRWASSASHLQKLDVTSAETWTWLHSPAFRATPLDMKADADRFFLQGINQLVGHGWPYSPPGIAEPGWSFYAAGAFNDHNPWWPAMPELTAYLQRMSYILRQGEASNDVAVLIPADDIWSDFKPGTDSVSELAEKNLSKELVPQILDSGFNFDFIDAEAIDKAGIPHRALVLPKVERLPLSTYQKILQYAQHGGFVVATHRVPATAPGLIEAPRDSAEVAAISKELFQNAGARGLFISDDHQLSSVLARHVIPDVLLSSKTSDFGFVHRTLPSADLYFLVNTGNRKISATATCRTQKRSAEWWDPFSGNISSAGTGAQIQLDLEPYESRVLVFSNSQVQSRAASTTIPKSPLAPIELGNGWSLTFPELHKTLQIEHLNSWSDEADTRFYSGRVVYEKDFSYSPKSDQQVLLDFGPGVAIEHRDKHGRFFAGIESPIREVAEVYVNDESAGWIWKPPYRLEVTRLLHNGRNHLRILVYNTAINELAGRSQPDFRLLNSRYGTRFVPQDVEDIKPLPSGILTAPRLVFAQGTN